MRKLFSFFLVFFIFIFFIGKTLAISYPSPSGYVNDYADLYSAEFISKLESQLSGFEKEKSAELAVVTIKSLEGESVEEYAVRLFEKWRIGKVEEDNGLLLLIAKDDRAVRIEVGYGLEPFITDGRAGEVIRNEIIPAFREDKYEEGTQNAINRLLKYISDNDIAPGGNSGNNDEFPYTGVIIGIFFFITYLAGYLGRTKAIWPGGAIGAILGLVLGAIFFTYATAVILAVLAGLFGLFMAIQKLQNQEG